MEFHVDTEKYKYKGFIQKRLPIMDHVLIYGYTCIGLVGSALIGMIVFPWIVLRKLQRVPQR
jgi:hypothetical protein